MKAPNTNNRGVAHRDTCSQLEATNNNDPAGGDAPIFSSEEIANMTLFLLIAVIAYVGWTVSPSRQPPSQRATRPTRVRLVPVQGIIPQQEPSTYG